MRSVKALAQLPAQLQQLIVQFEGSRLPADSCSLCHLTALTELETNYQPVRFEYIWTSRCAQSQAPRLPLPSSLRLLTLRDCSAGTSVALLGLQQAAVPQELQQQPKGLAPQQLPRLQLIVRDNSLPAQASELHLLSALTGLSELGLSYSSISTAAAAASAWGVLQLKQLRVTASEKRWLVEQNMQLPASAFQQLSGVTCLSLTNCRVGESSLRAIGKYCKALQELSLLECRGVKADELTASAVKLQQRQLRKLDVTGRVSKAALAELARVAPQLQMRSFSAPRLHLDNATSESEPQVGERWQQLSATSSVCFLQSCQLIAPQLQLEAAATVAATHVLAFAK
jgi:hypothetical protein